MYCKRIVAIILFVFSVAASSNAAAKPNYSTAFKNDPIARALKKNDVFVGGNQWRRVNIANLVQLSESNPTGMPVKVAVVGNIPADGGMFKSRNSYTHALHKWLKLGDGVLLVLSSHGVSLATGKLNTSQINSILQNNAYLLKSDPTQGLTQTIASVAAKEQQDATENVATQQPPISIPQGQTMPNGYTTEPDGTILINENSQQLANLDPFEVFGGALLVLFSLGFLGALLKSPAGRYNRDLVSAATTPQSNETPYDTLRQVKRLHEFVIQNIAFIDNYLDLLPQSAHSQSARQARDSAAVLDNQATELVSHDTVTDVDRAQCLLEQACDYVTACRRAINLATNGTGVAVGLDGARTGAVAGESQLFAAGTDTTMVEDIPQNERGACFFCSKPTRLSQLTPLTIVVVGQRRKVLACADDVRIVEHGSTPKIRMVEVQGKQVPWYRSPGYDPYRDYFSGAAYYSPISSNDGEFHAYNLFGSAVSSCDEPISYPIFIVSSGASSCDPAAGQTLHNIMSTPTIQDTGGATINYGTPVSSGDVGGTSVSGGDTGGVNW